jgi:hypothetical protein
MIRKLSGQFYGGVNSFKLTDEYIVSDKTSALLKDKPTAQGSGFRVYGSGLKAHGLGFRV